MHRFLHIDINNPDDRNAWYLCLEIFFASILASAATFNAAFALRSGATNTAVGLLTSLPALVAVLVSIPAGRFLQVRARRKPWILASLMLHRAGFLVVALLPWVQLAGISPGSLVVLVLVVAVIPVHFFNVGFIPMLTEIVPENRRASVFTARNILYNAMLSLCGFLFGLWLNQVAFPLNYQVMYVFAFVASLLSLYFLVKVQVPDSQPVQPPALARPSLKAQWYLFRAEMADHPGFMRLTINTLLHGIGLWAAAPLYILYFIRDLGANEAWLGLNGMIASLCTIGGFALWRWVMGRWGELETVKRTIVCLGLYPVLVGLLPALTPILFATALNGLLTPGVNLSHFTTLLKVTPPENRPGYTAMYITIVNIGAFICPLLGVALANQIGLAPTLVGCGLVSMLGSTSFWFWSVKVDQKGKSHLPVGASQTVN